MGHSTNGWILPASLSLLALTGCGTTLSGEPKFNAALLLPAYTTKDHTQQNTPSENDDTAPQPTPTSCDLFDSSPSAANRNDCIRDLKTDIDDRFFVFRDDVQASSSFVNLGFDLASLGLSAAGATSGNAAAKAIFAAINGGVTGAKSAVNEDVLYKTSIALLLTQMEADRAEQYAHITQSMAGTLDAYPMSQARNDLLVYFADGTLTHAIMSLQSKTSANLASCQQLEKTATAMATTGAAQSATTSSCNNAGATTSAVYNYGDAAKSLYSKLMPDGKTIDQAERKKVEACMTKIGVTDDAAYFIYTGTEDQKNQVLGCLASQ